MKLELVSNILSTVVTKLEKKVEIPETNVALNNGLKRYRRY